MSEKVLVHLSWLISITKPLSSSW